MTLISEMLLKAYDASVVAEAIMSKPVQTELNQSGQNLYISNEQATLQYLIEHCREGDPHVSPFTYIGREHKQLLDKILNIIFKNKSESYQQAGPRYGLLNKLLEEIKNIQNKQPKCDDQAV